MSRNGQILWTMIAFVAAILVPLRTAAQILDATGSSQTQLITLRGGVAVNIGFSDPETYAKLSTENLHHQLASVLSARPLSQIQKLRMARIAIVLSDRQSLSDKEAYHYVAALLEEHNLGGLQTNVDFDTATAEINDAFLGQLVRFSKPTSDRVLRTPVADLKNGLALGFFESAAEVSSEVPLERGATYEVIRKFRRAADDAPQNPSMPIYAIAVSGEPAQGLGISVEHPAPLAITEDGRLLNKDFKWIIQTNREFQGATVNLTAELLKFDSDESLKAGTPMHREALDIPVPGLKFTKKPNQITKFVSSVLDLLKKLFGLIGAIPALILAYLKLKDHTLKNKRQIASSIIAAKNA
jgi:hypothetical protein